ncbi:DUF6146 family protein [Saccharicrinis sp. GN24d3]|uniref:DUF6146 family protein n=1 Tax=Saccharicrinis sp. GN24d3 TaxID=3458416 RepID=UPI004036CF9F
MKLTIYILLTGLLAIACNSTKPVSKGDTETAIINESENDTTEYELIIFDTRYDSFLVTQPPKDFYSNEYYRTWNIQYVTEWNIRHNNPMRYGDFFETQIDYSPHIDYGIDLNYQLYNYFLFIEKEYGIVLVRRGKTAR